MNCKLFSISIFLVLNFTSFSQRQGFSIGIGASPDYHYENFNKDNWVNNGYEYKSRIKMSTGVFFNYQAIEQIGIRVGGAFARKGYELEYVLSSPSVINASSAPQKTFFTYDYIDIPMSVYLSVIRTERFRFSPSLGYTPSFLIQSAEHSKMGNGDYLETSFHEDLKIPSQTMRWLRFAISADFNITEKLFVSIEPYFTHSLNTIKSLQLRSRTYAGGLFLSVNYWLYRKDE